MVLSSLLSIIEIFCTSLFPDWHTNLFSIMATTGCWVTFYKDDGYDGKTASYDGPKSNDDLTNNHWDNDDTMDEDKKYSSLKTGPVSWLTCYSEPSGGGDAILFGPNSSIKDLDNYTMPGGDKWDKNIRSWQLADSPVMDKGAIVNNFRALFQDEHLYPVGDSGDFNFDIEDCEYGVDDPICTQDGQTMNFELNVRHYRGVQTDRAKATFSMNSQGELVGTFKVSYDMSSAVTVPDYVIDAADEAISDAEEGAKILVDASEEILTEGLGTEAVPITNKIIEYSAKAMTFTVDHINAILKAIYILEDDGGTAYFSSAVSHCIHKLMTAFIQVCMDQGTLSPMPTVTTKQKVTLNKSLIPGQLPGDDSDWSSLDSHNDYCKFWWGYGENNNYRVWSPEISSGFLKTGMLCSCKIDSMLTTKDDHLILNVLFDSNGGIIAIQGSISDHNPPEDYTPPSSGVITYDTSDGGKKLVQLRQGDDGSTQKTYITNTTDIVTAYATCLGDAFAYAQEAGRDYDKGTLGLTDVSCFVISAWQDSVETVNW